METVVIELPQENEVEGAHTSYVYFWEELGPAMIEFFLHGFGCSGQDFQKFWPERPDGHVRFFLNGPEHDPLTTGRRWFEFTSLPETIASRLGGAADNAEKQIRRVLSSSHHAEHEGIVLVGHSQGAMVSMELVRRFSLSIAKAYCYAGFLPPEMFAQRQQRQEGSVELNIFSSTADHFVRHDKVLETANCFRAMPGVSVRHHKASVVSHGFSSKWLDTSNFILLGGENENC